MSQREGLRPRRFNCTQQTLRVPKQQLPPPGTHWPSTHCLSKQQHGEASDVKHSVSSVPAQRYCGNLIVQPRQDEPSFDPVHKTPPNVQSPLYTHGPLAPARMLASSSAVASMPGSCCPCHNCTLSARIQQASEGIAAMLSQRLNRCMIRSPNTINGMCGL